MNTFNLYRRDTDAEMWQKAEILAQQKHMSMSELISVAVQEYLYEHVPAYAAKFEEILRRIEKLEGNKSD